MVVCYNTLKVPLSRVFKTRTKKKKKTVFCPRLGFFSHLNMIYVESSYHKLMFSQKRDVFLRNLRNFMRKGIGLSDGNFSVILYTLLKVYTEVVVERP